MPTLTPYYIIWHGLISQELLLLRDLNNRLYTANFGFDIDQRYDNISTREALMKLVLGIDAISMGGARDSSNR